MPLAAEPVVVLSPAVLAGDAPSGGVATWAPNTPAGTWAPAALPVSFHLGAPRSRDVGDGAAAELDVALRTWSLPSCTGLRATYAGERATGGADDGVNMILFHDDAWPAELEPGVVAQTVVHLDGSGNLRDADIHLNGMDFRFSLDGAPGTQDLRSVLVHELGHAFGLGHSTDARATMFAAGSGLRWRSLERDDVEGICALYPGVGAPGCDALPCPAGYVCVAKACQRTGERRDVCSPCERVPGACEAAGDDARCIDVGEGGAAGRVCGRACATDADCGAGFRCRPTTAAGDLQCVSDDACRSAASPCAVDGDCAGAVCRGGACVGAPPDAGEDASASSPDAGSPRGAGPDGASDDGCGCRTTSSGGGAGSAAVVLALAVGALSARARSRGRRRRRAP